MPRIAVDIHPMKGQTLPTMFSGLGVQTSAGFDVAYEAAEKFAKAFGKRKKSAGLLKNLVRQRLCSSVAAGLATARKLLEGRQVEPGEQDDSQDTGGQIDLRDVIDEERQHLQTIIDSLGPQPSDPKLEAVVFYLLDRGWLDLGCIVFSQFYDTTRWVGERLTRRLLGETVAVYAGAGRSGVLLDGEWKSVERDQIKKAVRERRIRLVVATDAACEGLNLQTLGTLINVDLPWNPSRLEQRIGRIKRLGQRRDRVDMLNLVYHGTVDEKVYETLSAHAPAVRYLRHAARRHRRRVDRGHREPRREAEGIHSPQEKRERIRRALRGGRDIRRPAMGALRTRPRAIRRPEAAFAGLGRAGENECSNRSLRGANRTFRTFAIGFSPLRPMHTQNPLAPCVVEMKTMIRVHLPTSCPVQDILRFALGRIPRLVT